MPQSHQGLAWQLTRSEASPDPADMEPLRYHLRREPIGALKDLRLCGHQHVIGACDGHSGLVNLQAGPADVVVQRNTVQLFPGCDRRRRLTGSQKTSSPTTVLLHLVHIACIALMSIPARWPCTYDSVADVQ
jgi:hypothetical protein